MVHDGKWLGHGGEIPEGELRQFSWNSTVTVHKSELIQTRGWGL